MKWKDYLIIGLLVSLCLTLYLWKIQNQSRNKVISQLSQQVDSLQNKTTKSVVKYRERVKTNEKIVYKWNNTYSVDSFTSLDTLFLQAKTDINYLDTSLKKCDTALSNCLALSYNQSKLINAYKGKKEPFFLPYAGVGLSYNKEIHPTLQVGVGINLRKLIGK